MTDQQMMLLEQLTSYINYDEYKHCQTVLEMVDAISTDGLADDKKIYRSNKK